MLMSAERTSDLAILLGHALQCEQCRDRVLNEPERIVRGRKISEAQRALLAGLSAEAFESMDTLARATDLDIDELRDGLSHPRARLRHL
jgi:hypothetical protein